MRMILSLILLFSGFVGLTLAQTVKEDPKAKQKTSRPDPSLTSGKHSHEIQALRADYEQAERDSARYAVALRKHSKTDAPSKEKKGAAAAIDQQNEDPKTWDQMKSQLAEAVERAFNLRLQIQRAQIELVEQKLNETREQLGQRKQDARIIIRRRVEELTHSDDLSWLGNASKLPVASAFPRNTPKSQAPEELPIYPRDAVLKYMAAALALDSKAAARWASDELAQQASLKRWNAFLNEQPHFIQQVLVDSKTTHSQILMTVHGERVLFELERFTTGEWRVTAINRLELIAPLDK
ncbi:hypothetical protein [Gimesia maris]|uniref:Uncharacterized protein n=1 Tax=Gimesia maris TaxID=122 RepID=A0ABX5YF92_9PLAN|nr:hypothetical protein [Gimesia maris]QDU12451.1 hypothetical protein CA11_02300 [Gimesia maris]QEG14388.1 hypothetical protein GmarT_02230 [Gimesia maris]QGQ32173.1 hypothetical protein F1729_28005 [Gimesia maris]